jgi:hypothetical protein
MYTPGTYVASSVEPGTYGDTTYFVVLTISANGGIADVYVDAVSGDSTKKALGDAYGMVDETDNPDGDLEWYVQAITLEEAIEAAQGWDVAWDVADGLAGVSVSIDTLKIAFEAALLEATPAN